MIDFDKVLKRIGEFGRYQKLNFFILNIAIFVVMPYTYYNIIFMTMEPEKWCIRVKEGEVRAEWRNHSDFKDQCEVPSDYINTPLNSSSSKCTDWEFDTSEYKETAATKWNLVCDNVVLLKTTQTISQVCTAVGAFIFAFIQDQFGRKPAFFGCLAVAGVSGVALSFSPSPVAFMVFRCLVALNCVAGWNLPYILALEMVGPSKRTLITSIMIVVFACGAASLGLVAYVCDTWQKLSLATSVPFLLLLFAWPVIDESPRWLLTKGKTLELRKLCVKIASINGSPLSDREVRMMINQTQSQLLNIFKLVNNPARTAEIKPKMDNVTLIDVFKCRNMLTKLLMVVFEYIVNAVVYGGLAFNVENLPGNRFFIFSVLMLMEIPAGFAVSALLNRVGRIWPMVTFMVLGGVAAVCTSFVAEDMPAVIGLLAAVAKFGISGSFAILCQVGGELFPTPVRGSCQGISSFTSSLSVSVVPALILTGKTNKALPMLILGMLSVGGGFVGLFLPETLNMVLPESIKDAKETKVGLPTFLQNISCRSQKAAKRKVTLMEMEALKGEDEEGDDTTMSSPRSNMS